MWIKFKTIAAGPEFSGHPGQVRELPDKVAAGLVAGGYAEQVPAPVLPEPELTPAELKKLRKQLEPEHATAPDNSEKAVAHRPKKG